MWSIGWKLDRIMQIGRKIRTGNSIEYKRWMLANELHVEWL